MFANDFHIIIGTKAQLIKMAPVMLALNRNNISYQFILTGQHQETMSDLISSFSLKKPDLVLYTKHESDSTFKLLKWLYYSSLQIWKLRKQFKASRGFIIHGDTLSTLWGAFFARLFGLKAIHIEAGLRSFNYFNPFPEELIRIIVTRFSQILFAGGSWAKGNLKSQTGKLVINTEYNTILDSLKFAIDVNSNMPTDPQLDKEKFIVVSIHRAENILAKNQFNIIMNLIADASKKIHIKMVLHPITRKKILESGWQDKLTKLGVELVPRMNYVKFMQLLNKSNGLMSDGGSNQEEASFLGLPCLLMRKHTERTEGLNSNIILSKLDNRIINNFLDQSIKSQWQKKSFPSLSPSEIIAQALMEL